MNNLTISGNFLEKKELIKKDEEVSGYFRYKNKYLSDR